MKEPKERVIRADIAYALRHTPWDLGNGLLYSLCRKHPGHRRSDEIIAKVWLIGRSYAAAIERRENAKKLSSDDFYEHDVVNAMKSSPIDAWLNSLPPRRSSPSTCAVQAVEIHSRLVDVFLTLSPEREKRSLASKYLHFHRPDVFFIYDSRAQQAITPITPDKRFVDLPRASKKDDIYWEFFARCLCLRQSLHQAFGRYPTPRELDKVLLSIDRR